MIEVVAIGLAIGCVYALVAVGYSLIYRTTGILNFAQGSFVMLGGMLTWWTMDTFQLPYALSILVAIGIVMFIGLLQWVLLVVPLWRRRVQPFVVILATFVIGDITENLVLLRLGSQPHTLPDWISGFNIPLGGGSQLPGQYAIVVVATLVVMVGLGALLRSTNLGRSLRACASSRDTSALLGISPERIGTVAMVLTAGLGALGGILIAPAQYTSFDSALTFGVFGFVAAVIGGFGSLPGALVGGLVVGVMKTLVGFYISADYETVIAFAVLLVLLVVRPEGLLGRRWQQA